jgi:hypothetical protein
MSTQHEIVAGHPEFLAIADERSRLRRAYGRFLARVGSADRDRRLAHAEFQDAVRAAVLAGDEPPRPPTNEPAVVVDPNVFHDEQTRIDAAERAWGARRRGALGDALSGRERELLAAAAALAGRLEELATELGRVRHSQDWLAACSGAARTGGPALTAEALVASALGRGGQLFRVEATPVATVLPMNLDSVNLSAD